MKSFLISGFEAFAAQPINPSWQIAQALEGWHCAGYCVRSVQLPVVFGAAEARLLAAIDLHQPEWVVCLGVDILRDCLCIENLAVNWDDAPIQDNAGQQPRTQAIDPLGAPAYFATLPVEKIYSQLSQQGLPIEISNNAGHFVCNHVFYRLMQRLAQQQAAIAAGFVHVPATTEMLAASHGAGSISLATQIEAIQHLIRLCLS
jgi:pyroglutamyl-peptidase